MKKKTRLKGSLLALASCLILILFDQYTKDLALTFLKGNAGIPLLDGIFELFYVENRGAAFGMLQNRQGVFLVITVVVLIGIFWIYHRLPLEKRYHPLRVVLVLLSSGAIGNMIDRMARNYVVDFFYFKLIDFPVFNVADIYVVVSVFCLAFLILFYYKEEEFDAIIKGKKE